MTRPRDLARRSYHLAIPLALLAIGYALLLWLAPVKTDSGVFLYAGQTLLRGGAPYVDVWDHKGPLIYLLNAAGLALGAGSIRGVMVLEGLLLAAALAWSLGAWARLASRAAVAAIGSAFVLSYLATFEGGNLTETWLAPFGLVAYSLLALVLTGRGASPGAARLRAAGALGLAGGVAAMTRLDNGLGLAVAAVALVVAARGARVGTAVAVLASGLAVVVPALAWVASAGALPDMVAQYLVFNVSYGAGTVPPADRLLASAGLLLRLAATPASILLIALALASRGRAVPLARGVATFALVAAADAVSTIVAGRPYPHYLVTALPTIAALSVVLIHAAPDAAVRLGSPDARRRLIAVAVAIGLASVPAATEIGSWSAWARPSDPANRVVAALAALDPRPSTVLLYGMETRILARAGLEHATPTTYLSILLHRDEGGPARARAHTEAAMSAAAPLVVRSPDTCSFERSVCPGSFELASEAERLGELRAWILDQYELTDVVAGYELWVLR